MAIHRYKHLNQALQNKLTLDRPCISIDPFSSWVHASLEIYQVGNPCFFTDLILVMSSNIGNGLTHPGFVTFSDTKKV